MNTIVKEQDATMARLLEAVRASPDSPQAHYELGLAMLHKSESRDSQLLYHALLEVRETLRLKSDYLKALALLGRLLICQGKHDEAIHCLKQAISVNVNFAEAHFVLGQAYLGQGKYEDALAKFRECVLLGMNGSSIYAGFGTVLSRKGMYSEAIVELRRALSINPADIEARQELGQALIKVGSSSRRIGSSARSSINVRMTLWPGFGWPMH